jgi:hypothetical protein
MGDIMSESMGGIISECPGDFIGIRTWSVLVGQPEMLRIGDAETEREAEAQVHEVIDRAFDVTEALRFLDPRQPSEGG